MSGRRQIFTRGAVSETSKLANAFFGWHFRFARRVDGIATLDMSSLLWGLLFGSIGLGFLVYGRKQRAVIPLLAGLALIIFPYFVSNTILLVAIGVALIAIPYFIRL
jgi:hypothetical protein